MLLLCEVSLRHVETNAVGYHVLGTVSIQYSSYYCLTFASTTMYLATFQNITLMTSKVMKKQ